ncbi:MAG TPA: hypothetical protein IAA74_01865 [Candidatus Excrementavichristensenella intestinipullorum]|nr:hypothetical protein [Candidatus Excrementavichristensenella intestinipullorum]
MESIILVAILYAIISLVGKRGKKKKAAPGRERPAQPAQVKPAQVKPVQAKPAQVKPAQVKPVQERPAPARPTLRPDLADEAGCVGGSIAHTQHEGTPASGTADGEGCLGGSLPHTQHEGGARRAPVPEAREEAVPRRHSLTPEDMRAAVVMAEILNRPVSLRGRAMGGRRAW